MSYGYRSITGSTVNIGSHVIRVDGTGGFAELIPELEAEVGITITRDDYVDPVVEVVAPPAAAVVEVPLVTA